MASIEPSVIHRMGAGSFGISLLRRFAPWWMWVAAVIAAVMVIAGAAVDLRISLVGFMLLLVVLPPALAFVYYTHALCRECFVNTTPHTVALENGNIVVTLYADEKGSGGDGDNEGRDYRELRRESFASSCVTGWSMDAGGGIVELKDKHRGFLWIPSDAFGDGNGFASFSEWARGCIVKD